MSLQALSYPSVVMEAAAMNLSSPAFEDGDVIPERFTCDGSDLSPPLSWDGAPEGTKSFAIICDDPDAEVGEFRHWAAYDIPADRTSLPEGASRRAAELGFCQAVNDFHHADYGGPCPPRGDGPHRYRFRLLALNTCKLPCGSGVACRDVEAALRGHVLDEVLLVGLYERA